MAECVQKSVLEVRLGRWMKKTKSVLGRIVLWFPRTMLRRLVPIRRGRIAFLTNTGAYACNPRYIYEELVRRNPKSDVIWLLPAAGNIKQYPRNARIVSVNSLKGIFYASSSEVWIDNGIAFSERFEKKAGQIHVQTMHGSLGIKKLDNAVLSRNGESSHARTVIRRETENTDYVITNSVFEEGVFRNAFWKNTPMIRLGHARTDPLFGTAGRPVAEIRRDLADKYGISPGCKIAIYAPTYRKYRMGVSFDFGFDRLLSAAGDRFGGEWKLLVRFHSRTRDVSWRDSSSVVNVSSYPDMQELMMAADIGITDYSSWIFDYVVTGKPGFIYAPDADRYSAEIGLCYPLEATPFPVAYEAGELFKNVREFNTEKFSDSVKSFLAGKECVDDGFSSKRVVSWIESLLEVRNG